jgi:hypothetical protein
MAQPSFGQGHAATIAPPLVLTLDAARTTASVTMHARHHDALQHLLREKILGLEPFFTGIETQTCVFVRFSGASGSFWHTQCNSGLSERLI